MNLLLDKNRLNRKLKVTSLQVNNIRIDTVLGKG